MLVVFFSLQKHTPQQHAAVSNLQPQPISEPTVANVTAVRKPIPDDLFGSLSYVPTSLTNSSAGSQKSNDPHRRRVEVQPGPLISGHSQSESKGAELSNGALEYPSSNKGRSQSITQDTSKMMKGTQLSTVVSEQLASHEQSQFPPPLIPQQGSQRPSSIGGAVSSTTPSNPMMSPLLRPLAAQGAMSQNENSLLQSSSVAAATTIPHCLPGHSSLVRQRPHIMEPPSALQAPPLLQTTQLSPSSIAPVAQGPSSGIATAPPVTSQNSLSNQGGGICKCTHKFVTSTVIPSYQHILCLYRRL